jgi:hypothetical protein
MTKQFHIIVRLETRELIDRLRIGDESNNSVIWRNLRGEADEEHNRDKEIS